MKRFLLSIIGLMAFAFGMNDPVSPAKIINDFITKNKTEAISIKAGLLGSDIMTMDQIKNLAEMPSREVLLARLVGSLQSSIAGFVRVLDAIAKKDTEAAAPEAPAYPPVEIVGNGTIGLSVSTLNNPFFVTLVEGAQKAADAAGVKLTVADAGDDAAKQTSDIEDLVASGISVLIVNPVDSDAVTGAVEAAKAKAGAPIVVTRPVVEMPKYDVDKIAEKYPKAVPVQVPVKGQLLWQYDVDDASAAPVVGTEAAAGKPLGYVQTYYGIEEIVPAVSGRVVAVCAKQGDMVAKGEIIAFVQE